MTPYGDHLYPCTDMDHCHTPLPTLGGQEFPMEGHATPHHQVQGFTGGKCHHHNVQSVQDHTLKQKDPQDLKVLSLLILRCEEYCIFSF